MLINSQVQFIFFPRKLAFVCEVLKEKSDFTIPRDEVKKNKNDKMLSTLCYRDETIKRRDDIKSSEETKMFLSEMNLNLIKMLNI